MVREAVTALWPQVTPAAVADVRCARIDWIIVRQGESADILGGWGNRPVVAAMLKPATMAGRVEHGDRLPGRSIVGLDLDRHAATPAGIASFACPCGEHGPAWPSTSTVATPSGGPHSCPSQRSRRLPETG